MSSDSNLTAIERLMSKCAALQGRAVPVHRFKIDAAVSSREEAVVIAWRNVFAQGRVQPLVRTLQRENLPALWFAANGVNAELPMCLLLRGMNTQHVIAEDAQGNTLQLTPEMLATGQIVHFHVDAGSQAGEAADPVHSARAIFWAALMRRRSIFVEAAIATVLLGLMGLATSLYTMQVYDRVIPLKSFSTLTVLTIGVVILIGLELLMRHLRMLMIERACKAIDMELSGVFFDRALAIRLDARPPTVGTFASQIRNFETVRQFMTTSTLVVLADIPLAVLFIFFIALLAGPVALMPLVFVPIAIGVGLAFAKPIKELSSAQIKESNIKNGLLIEAIDGVESIKAAAAEWKFSRRWRLILGTLADKEIKLKMLTSLSGNLTQTVQQLSYIAVVVAGVLAVVNESLTMGGVIACAIISSRAIQPIAQLPAMLAQWQTARACLDSLDGILRMPQDRPQGFKPVVPDQCRGNLRLDRVKFGYRPSEVVVDIERLDIAAGERVAILGPVGGGKSTLIKLISTLYKPHSGSISIDGIDAFALAPEFIREHVSYLPQDVRLFQGSLRDNLTLGLPAPTDEEILAATQALGLDALIAEKAQGFDLPIQEGGRGLSGGQRQVVGLARMLLAKPQVLLLDEPTASMDAQLEARVIDHLFNALPQQSTVVVATHKAHVLKHVQRIVFVVGGRVVMDGPRDDVVRKLEGFFSRG